MQRTHWILALLVVALVAVGGCGGPSKPKGPTIGAGAATMPVEKPDQDIAQLVPENTDVLLYIPSTEALMAKAKKIAAVFGEKAEKGLDLEEGIREMTGPLHEYFDKTKPMAVAVAMPPQGEGQPTPTMILPVTDVEAAQKVFTDNGQEAPKVVGSYVMMAMGPPALAPEKVPEIAKHVPKGDLVLRANLAKMIELFGEDLKKGLEQGVGEAGKNVPPGMPDMGQMFEGMQEMMQDLLDSAEFFDLAVSIEETDVHVQGLFTMKEGSKLATAMPKANDGLVTMAGALPGDWPVMALMSVDFKKMMTWMEPFMETAFEAFPEEERGRVMEQWKSAMKLYDHVGDKSAMGFRMDEQGMAMAMVMELTDSKKFFEEWEALLTGDYMKMMADMGVDFERLEKTKVAGYDVEHFTMKFDMQKMMANNPALQGEEMPPDAIEASEKVMASMFGEDGWVMHVADVNGLMVSVVGGGPELLEQTIQGAASGKAPKTGVLADAIAKAGGKPTYLIHIEGRSLAQGIMNLAKTILPPEQVGDMPEIKDGKPLNILLHATGDGRYYAGGFSMDVGALKDIVETFTKSMR